MEQEEKPQVCAHCKSAFTDERPLLAELAISELMHNTRRDDEMSSACIERFITNLGDGVYLDETRRQWTLETVCYFNVIRYYHEGCAGPAKNMRADQAVKQACVSTAELLKAVGFDEVIVQVIPMPDCLMGRGDRNEMRCLQVSSPVGMFIIYFPTFDERPRLYLAGTGIFHVEILVGVENLKLAPQEPWRCKEPDPETLHEPLLMDGGIFIHPAIARSGKNLLDLMILRQLLVQRGSTQLAKA